jgi:signal transduction histidine kinase
VTITETCSRLQEIENSDGDFTDKAERALELGTRFLGVDNGHVTRIVPEFDYWEAIASSDPPDGTYPAGLQLDLETTFCRRTIQADDSIALHDVADQGWEDDPAYIEQGLDCYHGTPLTVDGETYGTVCFVSANPRKNPFTESETTVAELIGRLLEHELRIERQAAETNQREQLIDVLCRVLRHNIRNDVSVIQGHLTQMTDQLDDPAYADIITNRTNNLLGLSEKARILESIIRSNFDYQDVDLPSYLRDTVFEMTEDFPAASFAVTDVDSVALSVLPTFKLAIQELLENAAQHARPNPAVTVTATKTDDAVEITVSDNGPGLPAQEAEVLDDGIETPLRHGSGLGLRLVYWVVTSHNGHLETTVTEDGTDITIVLPPYTADLGVESTGETQTTQEDN